jgi:hypothetical protein
VAGLLLDESEVFLRDVNRSLFPVAMAQFHADGHVFRYG